MSEAPSCAPSLRAARAQQQCRLARSNHQDEASAGRGANHSGVSLGAHAEHARTSESPQQLLPSSFSLETPGAHSLSAVCASPSPPSFRSGPTTVLVLSLLFIAFVVLLHIWGKFRKG